jgi:sugar phosphate permease
MTQRFFYGWVVLGAAFVIITMSIGTLFTLGVFLRPIEESMGWSRSGIGAIGLFNWIVMGAGGVVSGFVSDRLGTRRVVMVGAILLGLGLVLSSYVQQVWQLYVTFGLLVGFRRGFSLGYLAVLGDSPDALLLLRGAFGAALPSRQPCDGPGRA